MRWRTIAVSNLVGTEMVGAVAVFVGIIDTVAVFDGTITGFGMATAVAVAVTVDGTKFVTVRSCAAAAAAGDSYSSSNKTGTAAAAAAAGDSYSSSNKTGTAATCATTAAGDSYLLVVIE